MKFYLVPNVVRFKVERELRRDIGDAGAVIFLTRKYVVNYADEESTKKVVQEMKDSIMELKEKLDSEDEVFLVATGSAWHNALAGRLLAEAGVPVKYLVYEKKLERFVEVDADGSRL